jgi:subtilisin family serine protease
VGALGADGSSIADFSNHGPWVNVFAPGEQVQSAFVRGREDASTTDDHGADRFRSNTALWSGTSFACGYVSGYLAGVLADLPPAATPGERVARADGAIDALPGFSGSSASAANRVLSPIPAF